MLEQTQTDGSAVAAAPQQEYGFILIVEDEETVRHLLVTILGRAGYDVTVADNGRAALALIAEATPDLIVSDVMMPEMDGFTLLRHVRANPATRSIPVIMLTAKGTTEDVVAGLDLGADDYLAKPFNRPELLARVRAKIARPPVPIDLLPRDQQTGLLTEATFRQTLAREVERSRQAGRPGGLAAVQLEELPRLRERFGLRSEGILIKQFAALLGAAARPVGVAGRDAQGCFLLLLPELDADAARRRLGALSQAIVGQVFTVGDERLRLTPSIGYAAFVPGIDAAALREQAATALGYAAAHLDLQPVRFDPARHIARLAVREPGVWRRFYAQNRLLLQVALVQVLAIVVPGAVYALLDRAGHDITNVMYLVVVVALLATAYLIWLEGFLALPPTEPPAAPGRPYPAASAIIAAYLPNEAATVTATIESFLRADYPAPLQIILAYNTPRDLPVEATLREIAARDPRFLPFRVEGSTSKAQNINAALAVVRGEFVGVFDGDHQPDPGSFRRAWRWLSNGYDVVQGHSVVRNGDESWVARLVAVEFEAIYAVSHPGRARMHRFGLFGGSNGYWRTALLRQIRMHGSMLTEDVDSSLRAVEAGYRIASDRALISRELAPATLQALMNQRLRWAQGWFQVSLTHAWRGLRSPHLNMRQKLGFLQLLVWRELYPLLSVQMFPIVIYWVWKFGGVERLDWLVPLFVLTTLFTLSTGPGQALFAWLLAAPEIRRRRWWFLYYLLVAPVFYTGFKNLITVVAQVKELLRERAWKVTPRSEVKDA